MVLGIDTLELGTWTLGVKIQELSLVGLRSLGSFGISELARFAGPRRIGTLWSGADETETWPSTHTESPI